MALLDGQVCLVTGAGQGLGRAVALEMSAEGARVVLLERNGETLRSVLAEIEEKGTAAEGHELDVTDHRRYAEIVADVVARHGAIHALVNNAAINPPTRTILDDTIEDWRTTIAINLEAVYVGSKLVAPHMVKAKYGRIIHISSVQSYVSSGFVGPYNAAKAGISGLTKSMAVELGSHGILVNAVAPGFMLTPMSVVDGINETETPEFLEWYVDKGKVPLRRTGLPEDVSGTVVFLASSILPLHDRPDARRGRWAHQHLLSRVKGGDTGLHSARKQQGDQTMTASRWNGTFSRRKFLAGASAGAGGLALSGLLPTLSARAQDKTLEMWWWGEQELPGLQAFLDESVAAYKDATVNTMLQDTAVVISQFQTAAAAGKAPDIQYLWNGIYHMESVWLGYLRGLNGLVDAEVLEASNPTLLSRFGGDVYRVGWYPIPMLWYYNKELFDQAGLDAGFAAQDLGGIPRGLRGAQVQGHRPGRRRHPGRLLGRVVSRPCPAAEPRLGRRGAGPVHRRARLPRAEVLRAVVAARGAEEGRLPQRRTCHRSSSIPAST